MRFSHDSHRLIQRSGRDPLAEMSVQQLSTCIKETSGHISKHSFSLLITEGSKKRMVRAYWVAEICESAARSAQSVLKRNQSLVVGLGTTEIELLQTAFFGFLHSSPEQHLHAAQSEEPLICAAVFVRKRTFEAQSKDACNRDSLTGSYPDL